MTPNERRALFADAEARLQALERDFAEYSASVDRFAAGVTALEERHAKTRAQVDAVLDRRP